MTINLRRSPTQGRVAESFLQHELFDNAHDHLDEQPTSTSKAYIDKVLSQDTRKTSEVNSTSYLVPEAVHWCIQRVQETISQQDGQ